MNQININPCMANCLSGDCNCVAPCKVMLSSSSQCLKFNTCNAPVCPLDAKSIKIKHISGDKCCLYLLETAKTDAKANFIGAGLSNIYEAIEVAKAGVLSSSATIKRAYMKAASTPSRLRPIRLKASKS